MSSKSALAVSRTHDDRIPLLEQAAREVFELMLGCRLAVTVAEPALSLDITSMVGMAGQLRGVLSICCGEKAAAIMASKMLGVEMDQAGKEMLDALGEICNMVAGNFKNMIPGLDSGCDALPTYSDYREQLSYALLDRYSSARTQAAF
jgi:CheY-specific phosphatase CheX